jgi:hypothetical protein
MGAVKWIAKGPAMRDTAVMILVEKLYQESKDGQKY